ncbi:MAG: hypothetical protein DHS80DRAFT_31709 [Piptocephalis tieghemiana]|nr:MAG: hypothetical protein DHS80DRAFT_31709 [Piptocephalis tieghemiana]
MNSASEYSTPFYSASLSSIQSLSQDPAIQPVAASNSPPRAQHVAWAWKDRLYTLGGDLVGDRTTLTSLDPSGSSPLTWEPLPRLPPGVWKGMSAVPIGDTVWIQGGETRDVNLSSPSSPSAISPAQLLERPSAQNPVRANPLIASLNLINQTVQSYYPMAPYNRVGGTATAIGPLLIYIGGTDEEGKASSPGLSSVLVFDTRTATWSQRPCTGQVPQARSDHIAVARGSSIIIVGGRSAPSSSDDHVNWKALDDVAYLDTISWTWTRPYLVNYAGPRWAGVGVMISQKHLLLAYGTSHSSPQDPQNPLPPSPEDVLPVATAILDTERWIYVTSLTNPEPMPPWTDTLRKRDRHLGTWIGLAVGLLALLFALGFIWFRKRGQAKEREGAEKQNLKFFNSSFILKRLRDLRPGRSSSQVV